MSLNYKVYEKGDYKIQKGINIDSKLYEKLKEIVDYEYDTTVSVIVNICIENLAEENNIIYYPKPKGEISEYRTFMIRKSNVEKLDEISGRTGIAVTRLINLAIKRFIDNQDKIKLSIKESK